jgi:hypothetical protein
VKSFLREMLVPEDGERCANRCCSNRVGEGVFTLLVLGDATLCAPCAEMMKINLRDASRGDL